VVRGLVTGMGAGREWTMEEGRGSGIMLTMEKGDYVERGGNGSWVKWGETGYGRVTG
jgi:hypothetical protein